MPVIKVKDNESFEGALKRFKERLAKRGAGRGERRGTVGSEKGERMEGPLDAFENVTRNAPQEVIREPIVRSEKSSSYRRTVPAVRGHNLQLVA